MFMPIYASLPSAPDTNPITAALLPLEVRVNLPTFRVVIFQPRLEDPDTADVTIAFEYLDGEVDILLGTAARDSEERCWNSIHQCTSEEIDEYLFGCGPKRLVGRITLAAGWRPLPDDAVLGPQAPDDYLPTHHIIAAADDVVASYWQQHPSPYRLRQLEATIRGEQAVRRSPILRQLVDHADAAISQAGLTRRQAVGATVIRTLRHGDPQRGSYHVHLVRDGYARWHIAGVEASSLADDDDYGLMYVGDTIFVAAAPNGQLRIPDFSGDAADDLHQPVSAS